MWTNGMEELKDRRQVIQDLWRQMCLPEDEQDEGIMQVEEVFIDYMNAEFDSKGVLMYCDPVQKGIEGCGREEFFWDWLQNASPRRFAKIAELAGWREIDG